MIFRYRVDLAALLVIVLSAAPLCGQNYERYRPQTISPIIPAAPVLQSAPEAVSGSDKELLKSLDAVIVHDDADAVDPEESNEDAEGLILEFADSTSIVRSAAFRNIIQKNIGQPVSLRSLNQMSRDIILLYRRNKQPVVDVLIPEQKITGGTVQIVVIESRIDRVQMKGGRYFNAKGLCRWVECTRHGDRIYEPRIENDLFWLNQNPFRIVGVDLKAGQEDGTTDVIFEVKDVFPIRAYMGYDDTGVESLGLERLNAGFIYGNFLHRDGILSYQYTADGQFETLDAHAVSYNQPINRDWSFNAYGSWAGVTPAITGFTQDGESYQLGTAVTRHWKKNRWVDFSGSFGFDFKATNNNLEFGGTQVQNSEAELAELRMGLRYLRRMCGTEYIYLTSDTFVGPGDGFSSNNTSEAFDTIRANTDPTFIYSRLFAERLWNVGKKSQVVGRFSGQLASERLLFSETIGFGGFDSVRGYDQRSYNGDNGWLTSLEVGPRPFECSVASCPSTLRLFGFVDAGKGYVIDAAAGELANQFLISTGVGLRLNIDNRVTLRAEYGHGFEDVPGAPRTDRVHIGFVTLMGPRP